MPIRAEIAGVWYDRSPAPRSILAVCIDNHSPSVYVEDERRGAVSCVAGQSGDLTARCNLNRDVSKSEFRDSVRIVVKEYDVLFADDSSKEDARGGIEQLVEIPEAIVGDDNLALTAVQGDRRVVISGYRNRSITGIHGELEIDGLTEDDKISRSMDWCALRLTWKMNWPGAGCRIPLPCLGSGEV